MTVRITNDQRVSACLDPFFKPVSEIEWLEQLKKQIKPRKIKLMKSQDNVHEQDLEHLK